MAAPTVWRSATDYTPNSIDLHPEVLWDPRVGLELTLITSRCWSGNIQSQASTADYSPSY